MDCNARKTMMSILWALAQVGKVGLRVKEGKGEQERAGDEERACGVHAPYIAQEERVAGGL